MEPFELSGDEVVLRPPGDEDVDAITRACSDPGLAEWVTVPSPYTADDARGFLEHVVRPGWASGKELTWAVRDPADELLGMIGLHGVADRSAEIGYWVAPWAQRRAVARRAVSAVLDHAFAPSGLDLVRVSWQAYVGNWPSRRVAWRAGFRVEGTLRLHGVHRGVRRDSWVGSILRDDPRAPAEPWPDGAPAGHRAVVPEPRGVPVRPAS